MLDRLPCKYPIINLLLKLKLLHPNHYYAEFKRFKSFVIAPYDQPETTLSTKEKIEGTWRMLIVKMILAILLGISIGIFYDPENKTSISMAERFSVPMLLLVSVIILPLLEEIAFRLSLKFKPIYLALSLAVLAYYVITKLIFGAKLSDLSDHFEARVFIPLGLVLLSYSIFSNTSIKAALTNFWKAQFRWILYSLCISFAWIHLVNYDLSLEVVLLMPILTLPKLVNALCYGYVRINYGFVYSFIIHMVTNSVGFLVSLTSGD